MTEVPSRKGIDIVCRLKMFEQIPANISVLLAKYKSERPLNFKNISQGYDSLEVMLTQIMKLT